MFRVTVEVLKSCDTRLVALDPLTTKPRPNLPNIFSQICPGFPGVAWKETRTNMIFNNFIFYCMSYMEHFKVHNFKIILIFQNPKEKICNPKPFLSPPYTLSNPKTQLNWKFSSRYLYSPQNILELQTLPILIDYFVIRLIAFRKIWSFWKRFPLDMYSLMPFVTNVFSFFS